MIPRKRLHPLVKKPKEPKKRGYKKLYNEKPRYISLALSPKLHRSLQIVMCRLPDYRPNVRYSMTKLINRILQKYVDSYGIDGDLIKDTTVKIFPINKRDLRVDEVETINVEDMIYGDDSD